MTTYLPIDEAIDSFKISKHALIELVAKDELKVYFWFTGLLQEPFFAELKMNIDLKMKGSTSITEEELQQYFGYKIFEFSGYITACDDFFASKVLQGHEHELHTVKITKKVKCKQIPFYADESYFGAESVLDQDFTRSTIPPRKFQIIAENHRGHYEESRVTLTRSDCYFSEVELEKIIPTPVQNTVELNGMVENIGTTPLLNHENLASQDQEPVKKIRSNALRSIVERALTDHPKMTTDELWLYFLAFAKEKKGIFAGVSETGDMLLFKNDEDKPLSKKRFHIRVNRFRELKGI